ncbi:MAG: hypothetical protein AABW80_02270 [Nanoarchaeota archaeon]
MAIYLIGEREKAGNAVIFDGDGDGTSATAIWLMHNHGDYLAITNAQKNDRALVQHVLTAFTPEKLARARIGIFDLDAENNQQALEALAKTGANVDFVDHHTRDARIIPAELHTYVETDTNANSTATIAYNLADSLGALNHQESRIRAAQLAVIGLANDGKKQASLQFRPDLIGPETRRKLCAYGKGINFGAGEGTLDSVALLRGFSETDRPLEYLESNSPINELVEKRQTEINFIDHSSRVRGSAGLLFYLFPCSTPEEQKRSLAIANEYLNTQMEENLEWYTHVALFKTPKGVWRVGGRNGAKRPPIRTVLEKLAQNYGSPEVVGRGTASRFEISQDVDQESFWARLQVAYSEAIVS